jgi:hypothetical protein
MSPTPAGSAIRLSTFKNCVRTAMIIFKILLIQKFCDIVTSVWPVSHLTRWIRKAFHDVSDRPRSR